MDGLSPAASGIAVISLALQLVDSVGQIQRFLRKVSEAPKELRRLIELLEQLELILEGIGEIINKQQQQSGDQDVAVSETVLRATKTCENTVKGLTSIVDGARKSIEAKNKAEKTLACFRLSCKQKDIEEYER
jgi:t-SNARE complex subunit (syntaxin)